MSKGEATRATIVEQAVRTASIAGLDALSIGDLAARLGMSKSGLFAHFGAKEALQLAVIDEAAARFAGTVVRPALRVPRGLGRLRRLFELWLGWTRAAGFPGGCPILIATTEFEERPGPIRDHLARLHRELAATIARFARDAAAAGELSPEADPQQIAFELYGIIQTTYLRSRMLDEPDAPDRARTAFEALLRRHRPDPHRRGVS